MKVSFRHRTMKRSSLTSVFRPLLRDLSLVIVLLTLGLLDEYLLSVDRSGSFPGGGDLWGGVSVAAMVVPLFWRRRFPISVSGRSSSSVSKTSSAHNICTQVVPRLGGG